MKKLLFISLLSASLTIHAQKPNNFLQPDVWLRADKLNEETSFWEDQSKNGYNAVPTNGYGLDTSGTINFNKAITLNGENSKLNIPVNLSSASQLTIFTVYNSNGTLDERAIWGATINPGQDVMLSTQKITGPQSIAKYSEGNINFPVVNTSSQYWGKAGDGVEGASLFLGGPANSTLNAFSGEIAEFIVFKRILGSVELQMFQSYLSLKYGTTLQYSDYISSTGIKEWDYNNNKDFSYAIAGIGRDNGFELYQKQSSNAEEPEILTIGAVQIAKTNTENTSVFNDGNFLIWGMNDREPVLELSEAEIYPYKYPVLQRKWKMQVTGNDAKTIPTELRFNVKGLIGESSKCYLVIDRSGTGDFASQNVEYILADSLTKDGFATFNNILWDADKSGSDVFTLSFGMDNGASCSSPLCHNESTGTIHIQVMGGNSPYSFMLSNDALSYKKEWTGESRFQDIEGLAPGKYRLFVKDGGGNTAQNTIEISNPGEFKTGLDPEYSLRLGESLKLNGGKYISGREADFEWNSENGFYSTNSNISVTQPGDYILTITNKYGCKVTEDISVKALDNILYNYKLYPNPSFGNYNINVSLAGTSKVKVRIYSVKGNLIQEDNDEGAASYSFSGYLDSGLYFVEIETSYGKETFKLIVNSE